MNSIKIQELIKIHEQTSESLKKYILEEIEIFLKVYQRDIYYVHDCVFNGKHFQTESIKLCDDEDCPIQINGYFIDEDNGWNDWVEEHYILEVEGSFENIEDYIAIYQRILRLKQNAS